MKRQNVKTLFLYILTLVLCVAACVPAFASVGDRTLFHAVGEDGASDMSVKGAFPLKDGFCTVVGSWEPVIRKYTTPLGEPEKFEIKSSYGDMAFIAGDPDGAATGVEPEEGAEAADPSGTALIPEEPAAEEGDPFAEEGNLFADEDWDSFEGEDFSFESSMTHADDWFAWNGELYGLVYTRDTSAMEYKVIGASIKHVKLENGEIILEDSDLPYLDMENLAGDSGASYIDNVIACGDYLLVSSWRSGYMMYNLTDGEEKELPDAQDYLSMAPGPDGTLLVLKGGSKENRDVVSLNPETLEETPFVELKNVTGHQVPMCYDREKDTLYYVDGGEIWAQPRSGGEAVAVNECAISAKNMLMYDGYAILWDYSSILLRNTDATQRAGTTLRVNGSGVYYGDNISSAVMEMASVRDDVSVILENNMYQLNTDILQDMMNKDGNTDIYVVDYAGRQFRALRDRGYLTAMEGNQQLEEYVERMYPFFRDALKQDGKLVAVPINVFGSSIGVSMKTWKMLGGTEEDLPKTWNQFMDWLEKDLPERIAGTEARVTMYDKSNFYWNVKSALITQYQARVNSSEGKELYNSPLLTEPMKRLDNLDWAALKIPEDEMNSFLWESDNPPLLIPDQSPCFTTWGDWGKPLRLSFAEGEDPIIPVQLMVAIINPYSEHKEEAMEFLALTLKKLDTAGQYSLFADMTEPIEKNDTKDWYKNVTETIAEVQKKLETAEGEQKIELETQLQMYNDELDYLESSRWVMDPQRIEDYVTGVPYMTVLDYDFMSDFGDMDDDESSGGIWNALYNEGGDIEKALSLIDKKIQIMRQEQE